MKIYQVNDITFVIANSAAQAEDYYLNFLQNKKEDIYSRGPTEIKIPEKISQFETEVFPYYLLNMERINKPCVFIMS